MYHGGEEQPDGSDGKSVLEVIDNLDNLERLDGEYAPITRLPQFDVFHHHAKLPLQASSALDCTYLLPWKSGLPSGDGQADQRSAALSYLRHFACFICNLVDQEAVSIWCNVKTILHDWKGIIVAKRPPSGGTEYLLQATTSTQIAPSTIIGVTDFSYHFYSVGGWKGPDADHAFSLELGPGASQVRVAREGVPNVVVQGLFDILQDGAAPDGCSESGTSDRDLSILNCHASCHSSVAHQSTGGSTLHEMFEARVALTPHNCAIEYLHPEYSPDCSKRLETWSYFELNAKCDGVAKDLRAILGSRLQDSSQSVVIPVHLSAGPALYMSYLAILKAGCGFCPLPVDGPVQRLRDILDDIQPMVVLGAGCAPESDPWAEVSAAFDIEWLDVWSCSNTEPTPTKVPSVAESLAYVMYTSGSTGKPKGVQITQRAVAASIRAHVKEYWKTASEDIPMRWYQFAASTFDPSIMEIFVTLCSGGTLCSAPREMTLSSPESAITETRSTTMMATPGLASMLDIDRLPTLTCLWTMGELLNFKTLSSFARRDASPLTAVSDRKTFSEKLHLCNAYGPTEAAINVTFYSDVPPDARGSIIGCPLEGCTVLVADPRCSIITPVPLGFVGELVIGGEQVSIGYLRRPDENLAAFVTDERYGRLYRTGDRARVVWDPKDIPMLEYLGRISDDQVKINGQRVELGEIDSALCTVPEVRDVVTVYDSNKHMGCLLVACLLLETHVDSTLDAVKDKCKEAAAKTLPLHMQPKHFLYVNEIPYTAVGKVDRKAMASIASKRGGFERRSSTLRGQRDPGKSRRASHSLHQRSVHVLALFKGALRETIGPTGSADSAAEELKYWLDSLSALRFLRRIKRQGIETLTLNDMLHARSLQDLAQVVSDRVQAQRTRLDSTESNKNVSLKPRLDAFHSRWQHFVSKKIGISVADILYILPATISQERTLLSSSKSWHKPVRQRNYIHHSIHSFAQEVEPDKLKDAWQKALSRHDVYRLAFIPVNDDLSSFAQAVLSLDCPLANIRWTEEISSEAPVSWDNPDIIRAARTVESMISFERSAPVMTLVKTPISLSVMLSLVHASFDLASLQLLLEEVAAEIRREPPPPRTNLRLAVETSFVSENEDSHAFWDRYMNAYEILYFPGLTGLRPESATGSTISSVMESRLTLETLQKRVRNLLCSPLSVLQAAWSTLLIAYTSTTSCDIAFGTLFAGRSGRGTDVCMAPTFSVVPTRTQFDQSSLNVDILRALAKFNSSAIQYPHLSIRSAENRVPQYDTTVAFQVPYDTDGESGLLWDTVVLPMSHDYAVMIEAIPDPQGHITLKATYSDAYLDPKSATLMLSQLDEVMFWILDNPMLPYRYSIGCFEGHRLSIMNPVPIPELTPVPCLLHTDFEINVQKYAGRIALEYYDCLKNTQRRMLRWSYADLDIRADKLASDIKSKFGNVVGTVIPILMEKRPELYIAVLGVLKAGAAWSPIDISSPPKRRHELIARLDPKVILMSENASVDRAGLPDRVQVMMVSAKDVEHEPKIPSKPASDQRPTPESLAYIIWTSGTTGAPKGVRVSHGAACVSMRSIQAAVSCKTKSGEAPRCLQFSQHTFDVFVQDLFYTWGVGGTLVSASRAIMTNEFARLSRESGATHAFLTPAYAASVRRESCPTLEVVTMIGEKLPQHVADNWGHDIKAYNTYGPAEAAVVSTLTEFGGSGKNLRSSNIGRPLPSVSCHILREGKEVMIQGIGELALGGPQLADGYLNEAEITKSKFIEEGKSKQILYLTGDIVRQLADGSLEFIGREDDLVKLGGIRVELSEISYAMSNCHKDVKQIETFYMCRSDRSESVVSFIATNKGPTSNNAYQPMCGTEAVEMARCAMRQARENIPRHMIPSTLIVIPNIPRTSSGKTDRKILEKVYRDLDLVSWEAATNIRHAESLDDQDLSEIESNIKQCLSAFCDVEFHTISLHSSLNSLGIDSLNAARFVHHLTDSGVALELTCVLQSHTGFDLVQHACEQNDKVIPRDRHTHAAEVFNEVLLGHVQSYVDQKVSYVMPTTALQEGVLSESMLDQSSYWSTHCFDLKPNMDITRLRSAWVLVCKRTEALRTTFLTLAELKGIESMPLCSSTFIQIIRDEEIMDWAEIKAEVSLHNTAQQRAGVIMSYHQSTAFRRPPWAVTIIKTELRNHMILTIHHSIHDAQSIGFIMDDLASAYTTWNIKKRHNMTEALPLTMNHDSKADGQNHWYDTLLPYIDVGVSVWPSLLKTATTIRHDGPKSMISATYKMTTSLSKMSHAARIVGTRLSVLLKVVFGCLLSAYLEAPAIVFAEIVSQRYTNAQIRDVIAPLVATMPVPFTMRQTARELLLEHDRPAADSRKGTSPPGPLVRKLLRRAPRQPLYPAFFVFHTPADSIANQSDSAAALWGQARELLGLSTEHDVSLNVYHGECLTIEVIASDQIMDHDSIETFCKQVDVLAQAMLRKPSQPLVGLLDDENASVISMSHSQLPKSSDHPSNLAPTYWLEYHAQCHPYWNAVEIAADTRFDHGTRETWNFRRLLAESRKIAHFLMEHGYRRRIIAMCTGRTLQSYAIILGTLMSGNIYLPIDDGLPQQRKLLLLNDSECSMLFTDDSCIETFEIASLSCAVINVNNVSVARKIRTMADTACERPDPSESAYLIYTSGSTGRPKGVLISHRSLCGFIEGLSGYMGNCSTLAVSTAGTGKWLGLANRAFDVHLAEMFLAWRCGLIAVTAPRELLLDDLRLALTNLHVTHAICVPSLLEQADLTPDQLPDLVFMVIGGEKISKRTIDTWAGHSRVTAVNAYGPTELAIGCSASHIVPGFDACDIGVPYGDTTAHILVPNTEHYTIKGQAGELCFTGCLVGNGYFNRPEAKGFVDFEGQRMYRTGDMARMRPDGSLMFLGRRDDQTKLRGQRIELSEISESIRASSPIPIDVVTLILGHPELPGTFLTAFVSSMTERARRYEAELSSVAGNLGFLSSSIRDHCRINLPSFMVPDYIVPVSVIPLAPVSGKADVKSLKGFFSSLPANVLLGTADRMSHEGTLRELNLPEQQVASVMRDVLQLGEQYRIQATTNLFALGLHSLNALGLMMRLRTIGIPCDLTVLLSNPTIEAIASGIRPSALANAAFYLTGDQGTFDPLRTDVIGKNDLRVGGDAVETVLPCLPLQENTVTATLHSESSIPYVNHIRFKLRNDVDLDQFKRAWSDLIDHTPVLRTFFYHHANAFVQIILRPQSNPLPWTELSADGEFAAKEMISGVAQSLGKEVAHAIQERPPLRFLLVRRTTGQHYFSVVIHHALYDAHSFKLMMSDLWLIYQAKSLPPRTAFQAILEYNASQDVALHKSFWTQYLANSHSTLCGKSTSRREGTSSNTYRLLETKLSDIQCVASDWKVTLATLSQCIFGVALARRVKAADILFGLILSGRTLPVEGAESIRAPCIGTIPQRIQFSSDEVLSQLCYWIQNTSTSSLKHQHSSLRDIARWASLENPMFDVLFSFSWKESPGDEDMPWKQVESSMFLGYPLAVEVSADSKRGRLAVTCEYTSEFGTRQEAEHFLDDMELLLTLIANGEDPQVSSVGIVEEAFARKHDASSWDETRWSTEEILIKDVLRELTGLETSNITKNASFFKLGVDSVSAIRLAKNLRQAGLGITSTDVMAYPCIGSLGRRLADQSTSWMPTVTNRPQVTRDSLWALLNDNSVIPIDSLEAVYQCTPLQAGMITATLATNSDAYVYQHDRLLPVDTDIERFCEAWRATVQSLDILRTSFHYIYTSGPQWIACVDRKVTSNSLVFDETVQFTPPAKRLSLTGEGAFSKPPLVATLSTTGERTVFQLTMHHALYDGISLPMIFERLSFAYKSSSLKFLQVPPFYRAADAICELSPHSINFWAARLEGYRSFSLDVSSDIPMRQRSTTRMCGIPLRTSIESCKAFGVTLQTLLLTAYSKVLAIVLGRRDIVFGHIVTGRTLPLENCENIVGPLFNTIPLRVRLDHLLASNLEVMKQVQGLTAEARSHQHASLAHVQRDWRKKECCDDVRLFDCLFLLQRVTSASQDEFLQTVDGEPAPLASEYCLNFEIEQSETKLTFSVSCHVACLAGCSSDGFLNIYEEVLQNLLSSAAQAFGSYPPGLAALPLRKPEARLMRPVHEHKEVTRDSKVGLILGVLSKVSKIPVADISSTVSIFALGLTSLSAIAVAADCRRQGLSLSVADVLQGVTASGIFDRLARKSPHNDEMTVSTQQISFSNLLHPPLTEGDIETILPALAGQMYHLSGWLSTAKTMYMPTFAYICNEMNVDRLRFAWDLLRRRHPILRTTFAALTPTTAAQLILKTHVPCNNFSYVISKSTDLRTLQQYIREEQEREAYLKTPPVRLRLIQGSSNDVLLLTIHHALYDAISLPRIVSDLAMLYKSIPLNEPPQWQRFVEQSTSNLQTTNKPAFWREGLHGFDHTMVGRRHPSNEILSSSTQSFISLSQVLTHVPMLSALANTHKTSFTAVILLSFARSLSALTNISNPIFGTFTLGRSASSLPGMSHLAGPCLNVLPFVVCSPWEGPWQRKAEEIQRKLAARIPHEQDSLLDILSWACDGGEEIEIAPFNVFVNILWHEGSDRDAEPSEQDESGNTLFKVMDVGPPSDFISRRGFERADTGFDALQWLKVQDGVYLDIALNQNGETMDFGVRIEGDIIEKEEATRWMRDIAKGVVGMLEEK